MAWWDNLYDNLYANLAGRYCQINAVVEGSMSSSGSGSGSGRAGMVSSRFVSQTELDAARSNKETTEVEYDPRSLYERLQAHKEAKDAKYDQLYKLSNQFRGIDEAESDFLAQVNTLTRQQELERNQSEQQQLDAFRTAARAAKQKTLAQPPLTSGQERGARGTGSASDGGGGGGGKKKRKANSTLLGVVKKKPPAPPAKADASKHPKAEAIHPSPSPNSSPTQAKDPTSTSK